MDKVAQVVITKTESGKWKVTVQSLKEVMVMKIFDRYVDMLSFIDDIEFPRLGWEQLSLDS